MDTWRAKEIAASPVMANVTHNDIPVYIQNVDEQKGTARVYPLGKPEHEQEVPVHNLIEKITR